MFDFSQLDALDLDVGRVNLLRRAITEINSVEPIQALFLHGSCTRNFHKKFSDIDIIVVIAAAKVRSRLERIFCHMREALPIAVEMYSERFPWFGRLWTLYFREMSRDFFSIDIGFITPKEIEQFPVEQTAIILHDFHGCVEARRQVCIIRNSEELRARISMMMAEAFHVVMKIRRALAMGQIWNSIEMLSSLRRLYFELVRLETGNIGVGRAEKGIESVYAATGQDFCVEGWLVREYSEESITSVTLVVLSAFMEKAKPHNSSLEYQLLVELSRKLTA